MRTIFERGMRTTATTPLPTDTTTTTTTKATRMATNEHDGDKGQDRNDSHEHDRDAEVRVRPSTTVPPGLYDRDTLLIRPRDLRDLWANPTKELGRLARAGLVRP